MLVEKRIPWNKGIKMSKEFCKKVSESSKGKTPWNKGKTANTDERLKKLQIPCSEEKKKKIGIANKGKNNGMYGIKYSEEKKKRQSEYMKKIIQEGKYTPNIYNYRTHIQTVYKNKKFRSSWEAGFYSLNNTLLYEYHRIKYFDTKTKKEKIYISDFSDIESKIIYEIKPTAHVKNTKDKINAAIKWCNENGYKFIIIDENWFKENLIELLNSDLTDDIKKRLGNIK